MTSGPGGRAAPTVLVTNQAKDSGVVTFAWSGGRTAGFTVPAGGFTCAGLVVLADSGRLSVTIPTPSGADAGKGPITLGPSAWFRVDSTASAYGFEGGGLAGPELALLVSEDPAGAYSDSIGSAQACR